MAPNHMNQIFKPKKKIAIIYQNYLRKKYTQTPLEDEIPWITFGAIHWLKRKIKKHHRLFEWGSGGSTMFLSKRVKTLNTIEHDEGWFHQVKNALIQKNNSNVDLRLVQPSKKIQRTKEVFTSSSPDYINSDFTRYCTSIDQFDYEYFDGVLVDGRARVGCVQKAISKVKPGGFILLDNSERQTYQAAQQLLTYWQKQAFFGYGPFNQYQWETTIWIKP